MAAWAVVFAAGGHAIAASVVVGDSGQAAYSQAIAVAPGRGGMEPKLSLVYGSGSINGPAGMGWAVQGISQITRCPLIDKNGRNTIKFEASDLLCLDGQRLLQATAPTGSAPGAAVSGATNDAGPLANGVVREFLTENDAFNRIMARGDVKGAPASFKVWSKAGLVTEYGAADGSAATDARVTTAGHVDAARNGVTSVWLVKRITDTVGNFMEFEYRHDEPALGTGVVGSNKGREWRLLRVRYTGSRLDPTMANAVEFVYNGDSATVVDPMDAYPRPDFSEAYHAGAKVVQARLLRKVRVLNGLNLVREYRLGHAASVNTGRVLLTSIAECSAADVCLPATTFNYTTGAGGYLARSVTGVLASDLAATAAVGGKQGVLTGDFNGDGRTDLLVWVQNDPSQSRIFLAAGASGNFVKMTSGFDVVGTGDVLGGDNIKTLVTDVNGDGIPDLLRHCYAGACAPLSIWLGRGDGSFKPMAVAGASGSFWPVRRLVSSSQCGGTAPLRQALRTESLASANVAVSPNALPGSRTVSVYASTHVHFRDLDGDGRLDILRVVRTYGEECDFEGNGTTRLVDTAVAEFFKGRGNGSFDLTPVADSNWRAWPTVVTTERGVETPDFADLNGDALPDAVFGYTARINAFGPQAAGFTYANTGPTEAVRLVVDINGDGKPDIVSTNDKDSAKDNTPNVLINRGDNTFVADARSFTDAMADANFRLGSGVTGSFQADVNGDGLADFVTWSSDGVPAVWLATRNGTEGVRYVKPATNPQRGLPSGFMFRTFFVGDFLGNGDASLLTVDGSTVRIYTSGAGAGGDLLAAAVDGNGLRTEVIYQALTEAGASSLYTTGRAVDANPENFDPTTRVLTVAPPMRVVSITKQASATVGNATVDTSFMYHGMKAAFGRGPLGFASVTKLYPRASGNDLMVTTTEYHQDPVQFQYLGMPKFTATYTGPAGYDVRTYRSYVNCRAALRKFGECELDPEAPGYVAVTTRTFNPVTSLQNLSLVSRADYAYCDLTVNLTAGAAMAAPADRQEYPPPCAASQAVRRPYQVQSVERSYELANAALLTTNVVTNTAMTSFGEVLASTATTTAVVAGKPWSSTKSTVNEYDTAMRMPNWLLGRLKRSQVTSTVDASQAPAKTAGDQNPYANVTSGGAPPAPTKPPISPAALSAILQLLLDD